MDPSRQVTRRAHGMRLRSGTRALREIRQQQRSGELIFPQTTFAFLVKYLAQELGFDVWFSKESINALQEASERHLVHVFNVSNKNAIHAKRVTVLDRDMKLAVDTLTKPWDGKQ